MTPNAEAVRIWAISLRPLCELGQMDAMTATWGQLTLHVTPDGARLVSPEGVVDLELDAERFVLAGGS